MKRGAAALLWTVSAATTGCGPLDLPQGHAPSDAPLPVAPAPQTTAGSVQRSEQHYTLPALQLQRSDGAALALRDLLFDGRPVVLTFMYGSCATVCPVTNQTLVAFEGLLGEQQTQVNTVSVSIDPDHDTVRALADYAQRTGGRGHYFTSDPATSEAVQRSFGAWRGDKMNHQPVFLLNTGPDQPWVRLDGLVTPSELLNEVRRLSARRA